MAYGWYGGDIADTGLSEAAFRELIECIWAPVNASAVFLFLTPREDDPNNVDGVAEGYRQLAARNDNEVVLVPDMPAADTHQFIVSALRDADLIGTP